MGNAIYEIDDFTKEFIEKQKLFFVATASTNGTINLSPKGMDSLKVIDSKTIAWLNLTGSGNETAAHILENKRMTLMFCAFEGNALIVRVYGKAKIHHPNSEFWNIHSDLFKPDRGARQIFELAIERVGHSCGWGVPEYKYVGERLQLNKWADNKSDKDILEYWRVKNSESIDGLKTDFNP